MKVYISGPITGKDPKQAEKDFKEAEKYLKDCGHETFNPYELSKHLPEWFSYSDYIDIDLILLRKCDGLFVIGSKYNNSPGASAEIALAKCLNMPILRYL